MTGRLSLSACSVLLTLLASMATLTIANDAPSPREIRAAVATSDRAAIEAWHAAGAIPSDPADAGRIGLDGLLAFMSLNDAPFPDAYYDFLKTNDLGFPDADGPPRMSEAFVHACDQLNRLYYARMAERMYDVDVAFLGQVHARFGDTGQANNGSGLLATAGKWLHSRTVTLERRTGRPMQPDAWLVFRACLDMVTDDAETVAEEFYFTIDFMGFVSHRPAWIIQHPEAWAFFRGYLDALLAMEGKIDADVAGKALFLLFGDASQITGDVRGFGYRRFQGFYAQSPVIRYDDEYGVIRDYDLVRDVVEELLARGARLDRVNARGETPAQAFAARGRLTEAAFMSGFVENDR